MHKGNVKYVKEFIENGGHFALATVRDQGEMQNIHYEGGSVHLYRVIENYFEEICDYIVSGGDAYRKKFSDLCGDEISGLTDVAAMNGFSPDIEDSWVITIPEWKL